MSLRRVIIPSLALADASVGQLLSIPSEYSHYLQRVLRLKYGEQIEVCDGKDARWNATLVEPVNSDECRVQLNVCLPSELESFPLFLAQALPKADKFENILQRVTELGITGVYPFQAERSVVKLDAKRMAKKMQRWERIVQESTRQSERSTLPILAEPSSLKALLSSLPDDQVAFVCSAREDQKGLSDWMRDRPRPSSGVLFFVGPEGGFSASEIELFEHYSIPCVGLGPLILRTETAGPAVTSILQFQWGHLGPSF